jgi:hypothetical protein
MSNSILETGEKAVLVTKRQRTLLNYVLHLGLYRRQNLRMVNEDI